MNDYPIGIAGSNAAIYVEKWSKRKQPVLWVQRAWETELDGEPVVKVKIERVGFLKNQESVEIFKDAIKRILQGQGEIVFVSNDSDLLEQIPTIDEEED